MEYLIIASGVYLSGLSFLMNTKDHLSAIILRVIPGLIGLGNMIAGLKMAGVL